MIFDIIPITEEEAEKLDLVQLKLLRTAQQKKNELEFKMQRDYDEYVTMLYTNGMYKSSLVSVVQKEMKAECDRQVDIIREQLIFNMNAREPSSGDDVGDSGNDNSGYVVDYNLSYLERYIHVRDYYLSIPDPNERMVILRNDLVAQKYLGQTYYNYLWDYLKQFTV